MLQISTGSSSRTKCTKRYIAPSITHYRMFRDNRIEMCAGSLMPMAGVHELEALTCEIFEPKRALAPKHDFGISRPLPQPHPSLPLDRAGRLRGHVVDHAVDALDLVDDAGRDVGEEFHVE